ncbi:hypothetical protein TRFO_32394 [Tritrichomonas foetus]|uniref:UBX domain-containing protein n=1 Tax=Tritrichomonas foetus TaxID=1144522 RepID=A0A1J4JP70_9EUKA|nr:hypothetical protein TRFO_32394 [Tritrichomonas foetus]|eukprot:OHT00835.1 hypothetical protein TRFO_32394 [Tritrichomonas foetus]
MSREEREQWAPAFTKLGHDYEKVMTMSATEFINCRDYLESEGFKPGPLLEVNEDALEQIILMNIKRKAQARRNQQNNQQPVRRANNHPVRRQIDQQMQEQMHENSELRKQQNSEYEEALSAQKQKIEEKKNEAIKLSSEISEIINKAQNLPAEPENGITIAISMPDGSRIMRKFGKEDKGQLIHDWAAEKVLRLSDPPMPKLFELRMPTGGVLINDQLLSEQGITGRTMLNVFLTQQKT